MDFRTKKIRKEPSKVQSKINELRRKKFGVPGTSRRAGLGMNLLPIIGGFVLIFLLLFGIFQIIKSLDFSGIIFSFGKTLQSDQSGKTNILLAGIGGEGHDGPNLTDTIIVASIDSKNKIVSMISIPRDLYVATKQTGRSRINEVLHWGIQQYGKTEGMTVLKDTVSQITGLPIQYYVKIDFNGFEKIVDSVGGVDVEVESDIYDPEYPKGETIAYETFALKAGPQHLNGATALKYARSRHGNSGGNYGRAKRQQELLYALRDKALSLNILTDPAKIQELFHAVGDSLETNLSLAEIIELARFAKDMDRSNAIPFVINDDPGACAGLVYTPAREYFDMASVALPAGGNFDHMHLFVDTVTKYAPAVRAAQSEKIQVLNGTKVAGLALEGVNLVSRFCLNVSYYGNAANRDLPESTIYYRPGPKGEIPQALEILNVIMPGIKNVSGIPASYLDSEKRADSAVVIELGKDYLDKRLKDPFNSLQYLTAPAGSTSQSTQQTSQKKQS